MTAVDPICKMKVEERGAKYTSLFEGKIFYFCSPGCKGSFDADPRRYAR